MKFKKKDGAFVMNVKNVMTDQEAEDWLEKNPDYERLEGETAKRSKGATGIISAQGQGNYTGQARQKHGGWDDVLSNIEHNHPYADFRE